ncbi:hypothetical protein [Marinoscillum pacificum]|uniref:hypothetical protein n=1 Tax=Marinoscillum pacificum TaxID=392723 RepID=UPI002157346C|nr:hypothetical protein [Marinoscillum pacificum]
MGAWGPGIKQNDVFDDIYNEFLLHYYDGLEPHEIRVILEKEYSPDEDEFADFWTAVAYAQWMARGLEDDVLSYVKEAAMNQRGLELWLEEGSNEVKKRIKALENFYTKIQTERPNAIKRKKIKPFPCIYNSGDCITFMLDSEYYGAAIIISRNDFHPKSLDKIGSNRIALTSYKSKEKPALEDFLKMEILFTKYRDWNSGYNVNNFDAKALTKDQKNIEVVGRVEVNPEVNEFMDSSGRCLNFDYWADARNVINSQIEYEKSNSMPDYRHLKVRDILHEIDNWNYMLDERYKLLFNS